MKKPPFSNAGMTVAAVAVGFGIAWIDSRPTWDDAGVTAFAIFLTTMIFGGMRPQHAWLSALAVGMWIPLLGVIRSGNYGSVLALVFAFAGAYAGALARKFLGKSESTPSI